MSATTSGGFGPMGTPRDCGFTALTAGLQVLILPDAVAAPEGADFPVGPWFPLQFLHGPELTQTASAGIFDSQPVASRSLCASLFNPHLP